MVNPSGSLTTSGALLSPSIDISNSDAGDELHIVAQMLGVHGSSQVSISITIY